MLALAYLPCLGRGFVSEDFFILRAYAAAEQEGATLQLAARQFAGPWLELVLVGFYRPLGSALLQSLWVVFGTWSTGYLVAHGALHLLNAWLVADLTATLCRGRDPGGAAPRATTLPASLAGLVFALHPMHPNAVLFVASYATLYGVTLALLALRWAMSGRQMAASVATGAALLVYEQAAVLPALLLLLDLIAPSRSGAVRGRGRQLGLLARRHAPRWALLATYLAIRRGALGETLAGYESYSRDLGWDRLASTTAWLADSLGRALVPTFQLDALAGTIGGLALAVPPLLTVALVLRSGGGTAGHLAGARAVAFGGVAAVLSLLPFAAGPGVVFGNGRYLYLATAGTACLLGGLAALLGHRADETAAIPPRRRRSLRSLLTTLLCIGLLAGYTLQLLDLTRLYGAAGAVAEEVRSAVAEAAGNRPSALHFVAGAPRFLDHEGVPAAQVLHWGLADSLLPPFTGEPVVTYPVPDVDRSLLQPLFESAGPPHDRTAWRWVDGALQRWGPPTAPPLPALEVEWQSATAGEATGRTATRSLHGLVRAGSAETPQYTDFRLVVVTRAAYHVERVRGDAASGSVAFALPAPLLASSRRLYGDTRPVAFWWLVAVDAAGHPTAVSALHTVH